MLAILHGLLLLNIPLCFWWRRPGITAIFGDFSLQCHGYCIDKGLLSNLISQITVSGNFFELLKDIDAVANDFFLSPLTEDTGSASVRIKKLNIWGK